MPASYGPRSRLCAVAVARSRLCLKHGHDPPASVARRIVPMLSSDLSAISVLAIVLCGDHSLVDLGHQQLCIAYRGRQQVIGIFRRAKGGDGGVFLHLVDGSEAGPFAEAKSFHEKLAVRQRVFSRSRNGLLSALLNRSVQRASPALCRKAYKFLCKHGVVADGSWDDGNDRIRLTVSELGSRNGRSTRSPFADFLPTWLGPVSLPPGSRDPLGLQADAEALADELLPGLTVTTQRAGYYAFLCWAIAQADDRSDDQIAPMKIIHQLERGLALVEFAYHSSKDASCAIIGSRSRSMILDRVREQLARGHRVTIPERIVRDQHSAGCFRLYVSSCEALGLLEDRADARERDLPVSLTALGKRCADHFARRFGAEEATLLLRFALGGRAADGIVTEKDLCRLGQRVCFSSLTKPSSPLNELLRLVLLGANSTDAVRRCQTLGGMFSRRRACMFKDDIDPEERPQPAMTLRMDLRYLLAVFAEEPSRGNLVEQLAACHELASLVVHGFLAPLMQQLQNSTEIDPLRLPETLAGIRVWGSAWKDGIKPRRSVIDHVVAMFKRRATSDVQAAAAGSLLVRLRGEPCWQERAPALVNGGNRDSAAVGLLHAACQSTQGMAELWPSLVPLLAERHRTVSRDKGRQPWFEDVAGRWRSVDRQPFAVATHSYRISQAWSIATDLGLRLSDLPRRRPADG